MKAEDIASRIDHTNLNLDAMEEDISELCLEAKEHGFRAVCIRPGYVDFARKVLDDFGANLTYVACVVGFPKEKNSAMEKIGKYSLTEKIDETRKAIVWGANEIDLVIDVEKFVKGEYAYTFNEIRQIRNIREKFMLKVIVESCYLNYQKIEKACGLITDAGANCIKTSTGYADKGGAESDKVKLMKSCANDRLLIKASGGIKDYKTALSMAEAGADILGTSSGVRICEEAKLIK